MLGLLRRRGLLSQDRIELLLSWRRSGFSVHNRVYAHPEDGRDFEALVRYMMRSPVSLTRLSFSPGARSWSTRARADMTLGRPRKTSGSTPKSLWPGFWSRSRTPDATWCATTGPTRAGSGGSAERRRTGSRPAAQARSRRLSPFAGACGAEAPVGEPDPAGIRSGSAGVSSLWIRDAGHSLHHGAEGDQADRGPSAPAREVRPAAAAEGAAGGRAGGRQSGVRSTPW